MLRKYLIYSGLFVFALFWGLLGLCTFYPNYDDKNSDTVDFKKVTVAKACNKDESTCINRVLLVRGKITNNTLATISNLYKQKDFLQPEAICFDSIGGNNPTAERLIKFIKLKNYKTCLAEKYILSDSQEVKSVKCNSACPFIFLASNERVALGNDFAVGIHHSGKTFDLCFFKCHFNSGGEEFEEYLTLENHKEFFKDSRKVDFENVRYLSFKELEDYAFFTQKL